MKTLVLIIIFIFLQQAKLPRFVDYPVKDSFKGKPAVIDFKNNRQAWRFRTVIREGVNKRANFAGHYTLVYWGCGTSCQRYAIVNLKNGKVYLPAGLLGLASYGFIYRINSRLLIIDPIDSTIMNDFDNKIPDWLSTRYYLWDGDKLTKIDSSKSIIDIREESNWRY